MADNKTSGTSFASERYAAIVERIRHGHKSATLGSDLKNKGDVWEAGQHRFDTLLKTFPIQKSQRVIDYGCGSLRVGNHAIRYLDRGCYFGMDVTPSLLDLGRELVGPEVLAEKQPRLETISEDAIKAGVDFAADWVFSWLVAFHVHPSETQYYLAALVRLTCKPGARLFFNTKLSDREAKYGSHSWARPLDVYMKGLAELTFVKMHREKPSKKDGKEQGFTNGLLEFRRG